MRVNIQNAVLFNFLREAMGGRFGDGEPEPAPSSFAVYIFFLQVICGDLLAFY